MRFEKISFNAFYADLLKYGPYMMTRDEANIAYERIQLPERATVCSAGYDLFSPCAFYLLPGKSMIIPSGIKCYFSAAESENWHLKLYIRSSMGIKHFTVLTNGTGVIDADYYNNPKNEGDILIALYNFGPVGVQISAGDKIMQGVFEAYAVTEDDSASGSRMGGVGSTGR